jgi:alanyl-tRNA synthetase
MGNFSKELCGGTHVSRTGDIGLFRIVAETGIASGVRRIEAVAAHHALAWTHNREHLLKSIAGRLKVGIDDTDARVEALMHQVRTTQAALEKAQAQLALGQGGGDSQSEIIAGIKVAIRSVEGLPVKALRETVDNLKQQLGSGVVILANRDQDKAQLMVGVTRDLTGRLHAGDMVRELAAELGGKGGGRPDMAQGGGPKPERIDQVLEKARAWIAARLEE